MLLNKRVFFECVKVFLISVTVLMAFVLMGRALQIKDMLMGLDLTFFDTLLVFLYLSPNFLLIMMPVSAMLAVFLTFLRMGSDKELIALKAGGISLYQLLKAPILFGVLATLLCFWISFSLIAVGSNNFRSHILDIAQNRVNIALQPGIFNQDIPNLVFFAKKVDVQNGSLAEVLVEDTSNEDATLTILAPFGNLTVDYLKSDVVMLLKEGVIYSTSKDKTIKLNFDEYIIRFALGSLFKGLDLGPIEPTEMSWNDLTAFDTTKIEKNAVTEWIGNKIRIEMHKRWVFPLSCLVLTIFAVPIAASFQGVHKQSGLIFALIIFFTYYVLISLGMNLAEYSGMNPYLTIWLPVLLFFIVSLYGVYLSANERFPAWLNSTFIFRLNKRFKKKAG